MIRTMITPNKQTISFDIPRDYIGKEIEVIAFAKEEGFLLGQPARKKASFNMLHVNTKDYKFDRDEANQR
jgi:hypothetical protein